MVAISNQTSSLDYKKVASEFLKIAQNNHKSIHTRITLIQNLYKKLVRHNGLQHEYKTKLCAHQFHHKNCSHGLSCRFAHNVLVNIAIFNAFSKNYGTSRNPNRFTSRCSSGKTRENCKHNIDCTFSHPGEPILNKRRNKNRWKICSPITLEELQAIEEAEWNEPPGEFAAWGPLKRPPLAPGAPLFLNKQHKAKTSPSTVHDFPIGAPPTFPLTICLSIHETSDSSCPQRPQKTISITASEEEDPQAVEGLNRSRTLSEFMKFQENHISLTQDESELFPALDYLNRLTGKTLSPENLEQILKNKNKHN